MISTSANLHISFLIRPSGSGIIFCFVLLILFLISHFVMKVRTSFSDIGGSASQKTGALIWDFVPYNELYRFRISTVQRPALNSSVQSILSLTLPESLDFACITLRSWHI